MEENRKMREGRSSRKEITMFLSDFFGEKICEGEYLNTIYFYDIWQKMASRKLFCFFFFEKSARNENPWKRFQQ